MFQLCFSDHEDDHYLLIGALAFTLRMNVTAAVLAQSVERVDCRAGGRGFDS